MQKNSFDLAVLAIIKGCEISASVGRLYEAGYISGRELAACVGKYITLAEYNDIISVE